MSGHRYLCTAEPPPDLIRTPDHVHACKHDGPADPNLLAEHECECGMTWTYRPLQWRIYSNVPPEGQYEYVPVRDFWSWLGRGLRKVFGVRP